MATFPLLKTGAVAQYPLSRSVNTKTTTVRFLDGSQPTYRLSGAGLRRWKVALDLLDESELGTLLEFAEQVGTDTFAFPDPATGDNVAKCVISGPAVSAALVNEGRGQSVMEIEEVR